MSAPTTGERAAALPPPGRPFRDAEVDWEIVGPVPDADYFRCRWSAAGAGAVRDLMTVGVPIDFMQALALMDVASRCPPQVGLTIYYDAEDRPRFFDWSVTVDTTADVQRALRDAGVAVAWDGFAELGGRVFV